MGERERPMGWLWYVWASRGWQTEHASSPTYRASGCTLRYCTVTPRGGAPSTPSAPFWGEDSGFSTGNDGKRSLCHHFQAAKMMSPTSKATTPSRTALGRKTDSCFELAFMALPLPTGSPARFSSYRAHVREPANHQASDWARSCSPWYCVL